MTYTSVVKDPFNSYPGMIFTDPAPNTDGDWAKYGCFDHVDYTDKDINAKVFLGILSGDKELVAKETGKENPKVLSAGPDDTVFTYFMDHGNDDIICVGGEDVSSKQLMAALKAAYEKKAHVFELDGVSVDAWETEGWWANVRMSNTEPLVRLNLEGKTKEIMEAKRDEFLAQIRA